MQMMDSKTKWTHSVHPSTGFLILPPLEHQLFGWFTSYLPQGFVLIRPIPVLWGLFASMLAVGMVASQTAAITTAWTMNPACWSQPKWSSELSTRSPNSSSMPGCPKLQRCVTGVTGVPGVTGATGVTVMKCSSRSRNISQEWIAMEGSYKF